MKKITRIEIIRQDEMFSSNDVYFVPLDINLTGEDVKKFKIANPAWKVIAHCDPSSDTFEVIL